MSNSSMRVLDGHDLVAFITAVKAMSAGTSEIHTLRFDFRGDGVAIKINEGMWSSTVGRVQEAY